MPRIEPLARDDLGHLEDRFAFAEEAMGFVPNSLFTMARVPQLFETFSDLAGVVLRNELIPRSLVQMVALVASTASGCRYCQAHTGHTAERVGVPEEKLANIWSYESSDLFDDSERAALRIAQAGGSTPNEVTDEMFERAREFYTDAQLAAIVAVVVLFGYLNRWNDTVAPRLEDAPPPSDGTCSATEVGRSASTADEVPAPTRSGASQLPRNDGTSPSGRLTVTSSAVLVLRRQASASMPVTTCRSCTPSAV